MKATFCVKRFKTVVFVKIRNVLGKAKHLKGSVQGAATELTMKKL